MGGLSVIFLMSILSFIYFFFIAIFIFVVLYTVVSYTFESISIMTMGKSVGYKNSGFAWIPFYNKYFLGKIAGNNVIGIISAILTFISFFLGFYFYIYKELGNVLFIILIISLIVGFILDTVVAHKLYKSRTYKYSDILTIFTVLSLGLLRPLFLFIIRNKPIKSIEE